MSSWLKPLNLINPSYTPFNLNKMNKIYLKFLWFKAPGILGLFTHYETNDRPDFILRNLHPLTYHSKVKNVDASKYKHSMPRLFRKGKSNKDDIFAELEL